MKVAVVGSGVAGLSAAWGLHEDHEVVLYEAEQRLGGHTDTHCIQVGDRSQAVDSGFIVFNEHNYPRFSAWLEQLQVGSQVSDMSFGVSCRSTGLEYGTRDLDALLAQRRNLLSPRFMRLLLDLRRFYQTAANAIDRPPTETLAQYLAAGSYSHAFTHQHLVPMCAALWSQPSGRTLEIPIRFIVRFMLQHNMLQVAGRPQWRVVAGGSARYVDAFRDRFRGRIWAGAPVREIRRETQGVALHSDAGRHVYDAVFIAAHSDQALAMLKDADGLERSILGAFSYQPNRVVVHSDASVMPRCRRAWSSWNAVTGHSIEACQVSYWMNRLQSIQGDDVFVTLNPQRELQRTYVERNYAHPIITARAIDAQQRKAELDGHRDTYYCGAYWGWGFHEDGVSSALTALQAFDHRRRHAA